MLFIGTKNVGTQTVLTNGIIDSGSVYRKYCKKNNCNISCFTSTDNGITLNHQGFYHITATLVGSGTAVGNISVQLLENGQAVSGAISTESVAVADTEFRTLIIDYYVLVDSACVLG